MSDFADGVGVRVSYKAETTWDDLPGDTGAQQLDRVNFTAKQDMAQINSNEKRPSRQMNDARAGSRMADATLNGLLKGKVYADLFAAALMGDWATGPTTGPVAVIAASSSAPHFVRSTGSFITNGFKVGMIVTASGFAGGGATANNGKRWKITALTATQMTVANIDGTAATVVTDAEGDTVTISAPGKILQVPASGHVNDSFTFEKYYPNIATPKAMLLRGAMVNTIDLGVDQDANVTVGFGLLARRYEKNSSAPYYTSPTAALTNRIMNSVYGSLMLNGSEIGFLTSLRQSLTNQMDLKKAVFAKYAAFVGRGTFMGSANVSAYVKDANLSDLAEAETEFAMSYYLTSGSDFATADLMAVVMPRCQIFGVQEDDDDKAIVQQATVQCKEGTGTGAEASTVYLQDTANT